MNKGVKSNDSPLRQKAQEWLKKRPLKKIPQYSEAELAKLIYELEVHQAELELQNEELLRARAAALDIAEQYAELYDFAPLSYFTLSKEGNIIKLNLSGSQILGKDRIDLINNRFALFVSDETRPVFDHFLDKVLSSKTKETCEVTLSVGGNSLVEVQLSGIVSGNGENCLVTAIETFDIKKIAKLNKKEITVCYEIPQDLVVFADVNMFEVIIRNLVTNAVKFTPKGGNITISAKFLPDMSVEIAISDKGIGMNKKIIDNLFRLDVNTNRKGTDGEYSTGLGLIICKDLVDKHGGKLWVESEEGKGSTFHFSLPANPDYTAIANVRQN